MIKSRGFVAFYYVFLSEWVWKEIHILYRFLVYNFFLVKI